MKTKSNYSEELQLKTKKILYDMPVESFALGYCHLKSYYGGFGKLEMEDALACSFKIRDIKTDVIVAKFETLNDLVEAGWAVD